MRHFLLMTALAVGVTATTAAPLSARPRDREDVVRITPNQIVDMADARIAQLKADLRLTPDQDKNWDAFRSALHDMAQRRADRMTKVREQRSVQASSATPAEPADANARPVEDRAYNDRTARPRDGDAQSRRCDVGPGGRFPQIRRCGRPALWQPR